MNKKMIVFSLSRIMLFTGALMIIPVFIGLYYKESSGNVMAFVNSMAIIFLIFGPLSLIKPENKMIYMKEGFIITTFIWIFMAFFCGLPFYFSEQFPTLVDAYFEMASGLTTTGASVVEDLDVISNSVLFWRSFSHFIGGMGVLVLALAVLPEITPTSVHAMKAEVPGPQFGKLLPKIRSSARILYSIYMLLTIILILALIIAGMPIFDSINHALATAGTGGFGMRNGSIAYYNSPIIELILSVGMLVFGINFNLFYMVLIGKFKDAIKSEEMKAYFFIVLIATLAIFLNVSYTYDELWIALKDSFFTVCSIITTTGFATVNYDIWPTFSKWVILLLMFFGACGGSTAGGLKISRVIIALKASLNEIKKTVNPNRKLSLMFDGKALDRQTEKNVLRYIVVYFILFAFFMLVFSILAPDFESSFSSVVTTFNNVGPGFGIVGPTGNYSSYSAFNKIWLSLIMITGRLEVLPILVVFSPSTWRQG